MRALVKKFEENQLKNLINEKKIVNFKVGDLLRVKLTIVEGKKWIQTSEGICIKKINKGISSTFTIRRIEKDTVILMTFSLYVQDLTIEVLSMAKVRKARLYYLDRCSVKAGRLKPLTHQQIQKRKEYESKLN